MCNKIVLDEITAQVALEARRQLGDKLDSVILYGSYARGDYDAESDIDIMVLADIPATELWQVNTSLISSLRWINLEYDVLVSLFVKDSSTFYKFLRVEPFYQNIQRDGVRIVA